MDKSYDGLVHPSVEAVQKLLGTFVGTGHGEYPTISSFDYRDEVTFSDVGKPFVHYVQKTFAVDDGRPLHTETGYLRPGADGHVEFTMALPTGQTESLEGSLADVDGVLTIELDGVTTNTSTAKRVDSTRRLYRLEGNVLQTSFDMAAVGRASSRHLTSQLRRA